VEAWVWREGKWGILHRERRERRGHREERSTGELGFTVGSKERESLNVSTSSSS
jgi:hypothetical protein